jgi:hypothetical protein|tara:strand:- start:3903 stop:4778 length:876 start_codon:yes stop_codon:yes gene_type:complete
LKTKLNYILAIFCGVFLLQSCDYFNFDFGPEGEREVVARVNKSFLYREDISNLTTATTSKEDSTVIVNNYIDRWATQQLLIDRAKLNLNLERQKKFDKLVDDYKNQLYTKAYTDAMVVKKIDSVITENQVKEYFEANSTAFSLNETLYKLRYVRLPDGSSSINQVKREIARFNSEDKQSLMNSVVEFPQYNLNDSIWRESRQLLEDLPVLKEAQPWQLNTADRYVQLKDSLGVYLIYIKDIKERGEQAPLSYIKPTVEQIILNKRKQELIKNLRTDITKDAIKNNEFEIFN